MIYYRRYKEMKNNRIRALASFAVCIALAFIGCLANISEGASEAIMIASLVFGLGTVIFINLEVNGTSRKQVSAIAADTAAESKAA